MISVRGAAYIRVSTSDQLEFSPDAQKKAIMSYAEKNNIQVSHNNIFIDEGISGRKAEKRPAFMKMITKAKENPKPFDVILVHKFDRFARNREDSVVYKSLLKRDCNIKVISVTEQLEDDKFSIILESMLEAMAEYYSLNLSDEVKKGMSEKARRGGMQTRPPLGYRFINGRIVVDKKEREIVRLIYHKFAYDNMAYSTIAKILNDMGYRTKNNGLFQSKSIKYILENQFYIGIVRWNRRNRNGTLRDENEWIIATGDYDRIIEDDLFYKVMNRIKVLKKTRKANHSNQYRHQLSGLLKCPYCNGSMVYKHDPRGYSYFRCRKSAEGACTQKKMMKVEVLEKLVQEKIKYDFRNMYLTLQPKKIAMNEDRANVLKKLKRMQKKFENIKQAYIEDIDTLKEYKANKEKLSRERKILIDQLDAFGNQRSIEEITMTLYDLLLSSQYTLDISNKLLKSYVSKIEVDIPRIKVQINYYHKE